MTFTYACGEVGEQDSIPAPPQDSTSQESQSDSWEDISSGTSSEDNSSEDSLDSSSDENETELVKMLKESGIELTDEEITGIISVWKVPFKQLTGAVKKQLDGNEEKAGRVATLVNKYRKSKKKKA